MTGIAILAASVSLAFRGWAVSMLWGWFVAPLGVVAISVPVGMGLVLLVGLAGETHLEPDIKKAVTISSIQAISAPIVVCIGWALTKIP